MDDYQIILIIDVSNKEIFEKTCDNNHLIISLVNTDGDMYNNNNNRYLFYKAKLPNNLLQYWNEKEEKTVSTISNRSFENLYILEEICNIEKGLLHINNEHSETTNVCQLDGYIIHKNNVERKLIAKNAQENWWNISSTDIKDIREFYGEYDAYYFAWLQHITKWLFYLSFFGLIGSLWQLSITSTDTFFSSIYSFIVPIWTTLMLNKWELFNNKQNYLWEHRNFDITEPKRNSFYQSPETKKINYLGKDIIITDKKERTSRYIQTYFIYSFFIGGIIANNFLSDFIKNKIPNIYGILLSSGISTMSMFIIESQFKQCVYMLNDFENHLTNSSYNDGLAIKYVIFNFINTFYNIYYSIIYEPNISISIYLFFQYFFKEIVIRHGKDYIPLLFTKEDQDDERNTEYHKFNTEYDKLCMEYYKSPNEVDIIYQHSELLTLFSYMSMFASFFPGASILFLINNHYEIIKDLKLFEKSTLFIPTKSGGIGIWKDIYKYNMYLSIITNSIFLFYYSPSFPNIYDFPKIGLILVFEHFIILLGLIINFLMPTTPNKLKILLRDDYQKKQSIAKKNKLEHYNNNINNINNI